MVAFSSFFAAAAPAKSSAHASAAKSPRRAG
jgi:hypothetical protein